MIQSLVVERNHSADLVETALSLMTAFAAVTIISLGNDKEGESLTTALGDCAVQEGEDASIDAKSVHTINQAYLPENKL